MGLAPVYSRAIGLAIGGRRLDFVRTPKEGGTKGIAVDPTNREAAYKLPIDRIVIVEIFLAIYAAVGIVLCIVNNRPGPIPFLITCALGLGYVAILTLREWHLAPNPLLDSSTADR